MYNPAVITIRPVQYGEIADLERSGRWKLYRLPVPLYRVIVAVDEQGALIGFCAFDRVVERKEVTIIALESHRRGAGRALLDALKERAVLIYADSVLAKARTWWEQKGFIRVAASSEKGTVGHFVWRRDDTDRQSEILIKPFWEQTTVGQLVQDESRRQRLDIMVQRMVPKDTIPTIMVPIAFVNCVRQALNDGQIDPDVAALFRSHLTEIEQIQDDPLRQNIIWYSDAIVRLLKLRAPPKLLSMLTQFFLDYLQYMERRSVANQAQTSETQED